MSISISTDDLLEIIARLPKKREYWKNQFRVSVVQATITRKPDEFPDKYIPSTDLIFNWNERRQCWELQLKLE